MRKEDIMDPTLRFVIKKVCCSVLAVLKVIENVLLDGRMVYIVRGQHFKTLCIIHGNTITCGFLAIDA